MTLTTLRCQSCPRGFKRISCFNVDGALKTVTVIYQGGVHYDALVLGSRL
jgi:hypothetical protein